jgi:hypothetical protein
VQAQRQERPGIASGPKLPCLLIGQPSHPRRPHMIQTRHRPKRIKPTFEIALCQPGFCCASVGNLAYTEFNRAIPSKPWFTTLRLKYHPSGRSGYLTEVNYPSLLYVQLADSDPSSVLRNFIEQMSREQMSREYFEQQKLKPICLKRRWFKWIIARPVFHKALHYLFVKDKDTPDFYFMNILSIRPYIFWRGIDLQQLETGRLILIPGNTLSFGPVNNSNSASSLFCCRGCFSGFYSPSKCSYAPPNSGPDQTCDTDRLAIKQSRALNHFLDGIHFRARLRIE